MPDQARADERTARELRLAGLRAEMDQVMAERLAAEAKYRRLTAELIGIGAEARAELTCKNELNEGSRADGR